MAQKNLVLLSLVVLLQIVSDINGDETCNNQKPHPVKIVLKSTRYRTGRWEAKVNVTRSYQSDGGTNPIMFDLQRNITSCDTTAPISLVANIVVSPIPKSAAEVTPEIHTIPGSGNYSFYTAAAEWHEAKQACEIEGSRLAIVNSEAEAKDLANILLQHSTIKNNDAGYIQAYVGASDVATEGFFITVEGVPLNQSGYFEWRHGAPGARVLDGDCVTLGTDGKLDAVGCKTTLPFLCEKETKEISLHSPHNE